MTRIHHDRPTKGAFGASTLDRTRAAASRKKKGYKVMMEVVEQEKKKLRSVPTYTADAPPGYMFVPLGYHSDLTEYCKERCRKRNLPVHVVSAKPKGKAQTGPENESAPRIDTQRIGHHFPNEIIDEACDVLGYRYRNGVFQKSTRNYDNNQLSRKIQSIQYDQQRMVLHDRPNPAKSREQVQAAVLEVFPKIPDADLTAILDHAFEEGSKRVGNATELTLARRVQLAVGAYIRHQYTDYDKLLKSGVTWPDARQLAQPASYAKLKEWRDEAESNELEETFREIIVLDDDDDDDHSSSDGSSSASLDRDHSMDVEYISSQATARELQPEETAFLARPDPYAASRRSRRTIYLPLHRPSGPTSLVNPMDVYNARQANRVHVRPHPFTMSRQPQAQRRHDSRVSAAPYVADSRSRPVFAPRPAMPTPARRLVQDEDGRYLELRPIEEPETVAELSADPRVVGYPPSNISVTQLIRNGSIQPARRPHPTTNDYDLDRSAPHALPRRASGEDVILPSIEQEHETMPSPRRVDESSQFSRIDRRSIPRGYASAMPAEEQRPKRDLYAAALNDQDHTSNRSRLVYRNEYPSYEATHGSMFSRLHNREPMARPRIPPQNEVIELTSSPQRPSSSGRHERYAPAHPYATTLPNHRPRIPDSHREYNTHGSEHLPPVEYVTRSQHAEPSHVYTRAAVSDESRYTGSVPQYGRRDLH